MKQLTQEQFWASCDSNMSRPVNLQKADLGKPFVYDREYGLFYVPSGYHASALALIYAWKKGKERAYELEIKSLSDAADKLMEEYQGVAMRSSVGKTVQAFLPSSLNEEEKDFFGKITYVGC